MIRASTFVASQSVPFVAFCSGTMSASIDVKVILMNPIIRKMKPEMMKQIIEPVVIKLEMMKQIIELVVIKQLHEERKQDQDVMQQRKH
jgi:hypothetical protein